jgi:hypothetical protein
VVVSLFKGFECQQLQYFYDIKNEPKFQRENVDFIEKKQHIVCVKNKRKNGKENKRNGDTIWH